MCWRWYWGMCSAFLLLWNNKRQCALTLLVCFTTVLCWALTISPFTTTGILQLFSLIFILWVTQFLFFEKGLVLDVMELKWIFWKNMIFVWFGFVCSETEISKLRHTQSFLLRYGMVSVIYIKQMILITIILTTMKPQSRKC